MRTIGDICEHLRSLQQCDETYRLEDALRAADHDMPQLFSSATANDIFAFRDARKLIQGRLNRLMAARQRSPK